jgi:hypothetical protein
VLVCTVTESFAGRAFVLKLSSVVAVMKGALFERFIDRISTSYLSVNCKHLNDIYFIFSVQMYRYHFAIVQQCANVHSVLLCVHMVAVL